MTAEARSEISARAGGRLPGGGDMSRPDTTRGQTSDGPGETELGIWNEDIYTDEGMLK